MKDKMKKRNSKRKVAFALALSMICSFSQVIGASGEFSYVNTVAYANDSKSNITGSNTSGATEASKFNKIDVAISNQLELGNSFKCTVTLSKQYASGDYQEVTSQEIDVTAEKNSTVSTDFDYIEDGTYKVTVAAPGFATFEQVIENVQGEICTLRLTAGFQAGYKYKNSVKSEHGYETKLENDHPGVLIVGDVNNNGKISKDDEDALVKAIDSEKTVDNSDLNLDSKTDLTDLQFFAKSYFESQESDDTTAIVERKFSPLAFSAKLDEGTKMADNSVNIASLFEIDDNYDADINEDKTEEEVKEEKKVLLQPTNDEAISVDNPVGIDIDTSKIDFSKCSSIEIPTNATEGNIILEDENGNPIPICNDGHLVDSVHAIGENESESAVTVELKDGVFKINVGNQIAVKKVTLKITAIQMEEGVTNLAEISKVKFVNDMDKRVSAPVMDVPKMNTPTTGNMKITATWTPCVNVTEYEVQVATDPNFTKLLKIPTSIFTAPTITLESEHGNTKLIKNYTTHYIRVRSLNGTWKSDWSEAVTAYPKPTGVPDQPKSVTVSGSYRSMTVKWNGDNTNSTQKYYIYYRVRGSNEEYQLHGTTTGTSYSITDLKDQTTYETYVVAENEFGFSRASESGSGTTTNPDPPKVPKFGVIHQKKVTDEDGNTILNEDGSIKVDPFAHIESIKLISGGEMVDSPADEDTTDNSAWGLVDDDVKSYYKGSYSSNCLEVEFDQAYDIGGFAIIVPYGSYDFYGCTVKYWDENDNAYTISKSGGYIDGTTKPALNNKTYRYMYFKNKGIVDSKIHAKKMRISFSAYSGKSAELVMSEIYFFKYDSTMDEIMGLYEDSLHTVLKNNVTEQLIDKLDSDINQPDEGGNVRTSTNKEELNKEIVTARSLFNAKNLNPSVQIHKEITNQEWNGDKAVGVGRNFSGLNAWQPLGVSVGVNETVTVYVGADSVKSNQSTDLRLLVTQYNSEYGNVVLKDVALKTGANIIDLNEIVLTEAEGKSLYANVEAGGSMYVYHTGAPSKIEYAVRVDGGVEIPMLDLYGIKEDDVRKEKAEAYITKLDAYVEKLEEIHNEHHKNSKYQNNNNIEANTRLAMDYKKETCIAGATEIMFDSMLYSLPAKQILSGLGNGSTEARAEQLLQSIDSMEDMIYLFYQHKGLNKDAALLEDKIPNRHLNIRYQRMFQGAAMYAAGNHIGIQWGTAPSMVNSKGVTDENGKYVSGSYFGWGIAHEIGHCLNDGNYAVAEITNNYFSLLSQSQDKNAGSRLQYNNVLKKVTSGTKGNAEQLTQLGMYWQLHLAYDKDYNYKTYENYNEQLDNLFYARMDTYSRNPSKAPGNVALTLSGANSDQKLMRLACAAAEKNILEFFERWGKTPDNATIEYASQFPKETRAIMYANEDSRVYAMTGESSLVKEDGTAVKAIDNVEVEVGNTSTTANKVTLNITPVANVLNKSSDFLGYEIIRYTTSEGKVIGTPVGFVGFDKKSLESMSFTDTVMTINNRTVFYGVVLVDQYLNRSEAFKTKTVKIEHDGSLDKTNWNISAEFEVSTTSNSVDADEPVECDKIVENPAADAIDNKFDTIYTPEVKVDNAEIVIDFNQTLTVTGLKYRPGSIAEGNKAIEQYRVYVMSNNDWVEVASGSFKLTEPSETIYFANSDQKYVGTYEATAVKIAIPNQKGTTLSIAELDVLGVTGDNVDFRRDGETSQAAIGILSHEFKYGKDDEDVIPEGSLVFTGSYKGSPDYNVVVLYDEDGKIVAGYNKESKSYEAGHIILADVPKAGNIANVSNGTWLYWIEQDNIEGMKWPKEVRVELYRVNDPESNIGQRIVSDSLPETVPAMKEMSQITF